MQEGRRTDQGTGAPAQLLRENPKMRLGKSAYDWTSPLFEPLD